MKADITYEVRSKHIDGEGYGGTYTERTLWRVTVINGVKMKDEQCIAEFRSNSEADIFQAWLKDKDGK
jgi:hypothetical protein